MSVPLRRMRPRAKRLNWMTAPKGPVQRGIRRRKAVERSSKRWGLGGTAGQVKVHPKTGAIIDPRRRMAAKIKSTRRVYRAMSKYGLTVPGIKAMRSDRKSMARAIRSYDSADRRAIYGSLGVKPRTARQRAQSRINGAKNRGRGRRGGR